MWKVCGFNFAPAERSNGMARHRLRVALGMAGSLPGPHTGAPSPSRAVSFGERGREEHKVRSENKESPSL